MIDLKLILNYIRQSLCFIIIFIILFENRQLAEEEGFGGGRGIKKEKEGWVLG